MQTVNHGVELRVFEDLGLFSKAVEQAGFTFDFDSVTRLNTSFVKSSEKYLILNVKDYEDEDPNNLIFLSEDKAFLYSKKPPSPQAFEAFTKVYSKPFGKSTVLAFLTLNKAQANYKMKLEYLINALKELEERFNAKKYRDVALEFERLYDRLEDFHDILMRLEERTIKEVETRYISFDYSVLIAEGAGLLDRCRNRFNMLRDIARDHEMQVTVELNKRIEKLNDVVKKLTALTVVLMIPNVIAGHFGMNFVFMPELRVPIAYPIVIVAQVILSVTAVLVFRRIKWL